MIARKLKNLIKIVFTILIICNLVKLIQSGQKPKLTERVRDRYYYYVYENNSVDLDCEATGDPKPNITWYIYNEHYNQYDIDCNDSDFYECNGYSLRVKNHIKDAKYICEVCNKFGCNSNMMGTMHYFHQISGPTDGVRVNDNAFLECSIRNHGNNFLGFASSLIWFKHNSKTITKQKSEKIIEQMQSERQNYIYLVEREILYDVRTLESSGAESLLLKFLNVSSSDEGWYTCVTRFYFENTFHAKSFYLRVLNNLEAYSMSATISGETNLEVKESRYFILYCPYNNSYTPNINWHHNDTTLNCNRDKRILCTDLSVLIENVVWSDAGTYKCSACTDTDCSETLEEFNVNVTENKERIYFKQYPKNQTAQVKSTVTFECETETDYVFNRLDWLKFTDKANAMKTLTNMEFFYSIQWARSSHMKLFESVNITLLNIRVSILELSNITFDDEAWYACCLYNDHTQDIRSAYLTVESPPVFKVQSENQAVHEYQPYNLKCKAMGKPMPNLKWYHNGKEMVDEHKNPYTKNIIVRGQATLNESGTYKCIASNFLGTIEHTFLLVVIQLKPNDMDYNLDENLDNDLQLNLTSSLSEVGLLTNNITIECRTNEPTFGKLLWLKIMQKRVTKDMLELIFEQIYVEQSATFQNKYKELIDTLNITTIEVSNHNSKKFQNETINLVNLSYYDEGWYACIFLNADFNKWIKFKTAYEIIYLGVVNETIPKFRNISTVNLYEISATQTLKLNCSADGRPMPDINWYHNGSLLNCNGEQVFCKDFHLVLVNASLNDSGRYNCKVNNTHGYIQHEVNVRVLNKKSNIAVNNQSNYSTTIAISASSVVLFLICLCVVIYVSVKRDKKNKARLKTMERTVHKWTKIVIVRWPGIYEPDYECESITPLIEIQEQKDRPVRCAEEEYLYEPNEQWEIQRSNIVLGATLGEGYFGRVVMGQSNDLKDNNGCPIEVVAVKILKDDPTEMDVRNLVHELEIMKAIGKHINVVSLLGCCSQNGPLWLVMEYAKYGNLKNFLQNYKNNLNEQQNYVNFECIALKRFSLESEQLILFAYQIAQGMDYLISKRCIHRDLAARNILVASDYVMKIADFGLARDLQLSEYYRKDKNHIIPVKWMAPEALDTQKFTRATDVWSYGILLWEIMSYGEEPYKDISTILGLMSFLWHGERLSRPENCTDCIYEIMQSCWNINPELRPSFKEIVCKLRSLIENNLDDDDYLELE